MKNPKDKAANQAMEETEALAERCVQALGENGWNPNPVPPISRGWDASGDYQIDVAFALGHGIDQTLRSTVCRTPPAHAEEHDIPLLWLYGVPHAKDVSGLVEKHITKMTAYYEGYMVDAGTGEAISESV